MRVHGVHILRDRWQASATYGQPYGVALFYGFKRGYRNKDFGLALCAKLTKAQRKIVLQAKEEMEQWTERKEILKWAGTLE